jgi:hypothetical protein
MTTSLLDADSLLAIDVGEINTRALLFDVVEGHYRFLAAGTAASTVGAPYHDIGEGVRMALDNLQVASGRPLISPDERLIMPATENGSGTDTFVATVSAGPPLKIALVGLLEDVSVESAQHLATTTYAKVVKSFSLNDRLRSEERIDAILKLRPDVIVVTGGTDHGASQSVLKMVESIGLACYLFPESQRPIVLYAGNQALAEDVQSSLKPITTVLVAPNLRPVLEMEQLSPAHKEVVEIYRTVRSRQIAGITELGGWAGDDLYPTATAFGRIVRFLSGFYDPAKGVLGLDVGASATTIAASFSGDLNLGVYPELGLGSGITGMLECVPLNDVARWIPLEIHKNEIHDYVFNKSLAPGSLPVTAEDLAIEQALAQQAMRTALKRISSTFPKNYGYTGMNLTPWFEPIVAAGSVLTRAPTLGQATMMLLNALQPTGITTIVLDQNNIAAPLGAAARINPTLVVQILESSTFINLGTVISPLSNTRFGTPILRVKIRYESGEEASVDVKQGAIEVLRLPLGQSAQLQLQPFHRADVGMGGAGRGGRLKVMGGALGVVIDARGRPLHLPEDDGHRRDLLKKWLWTLGG